jgi:hypothetical protein
VLLYNSPSGLVLYWTLNNVFSLGKHIYHKIKTPKKRYALISLISALLALMVLYLQRKQLGNDKVRTLISLACVTAALLLALAPVLKRRLSLFLRGVFVSDGAVRMLFLVSAAGLALLSGLYLPVSLVSSSPVEFAAVDGQFPPLFFVGNAFLQSGGLFFFWPVCIYALFAESRSRRLCFAFFACFVFLTALCDVFIFPGNYGPIGINLVFAGGISQAARNETLLNMAVIALTFTAAALAAFAFPKKLYSAAIGLCAVCAVALAALSVRGILSIREEIRKTNDYARAPQEETTAPEPVFELSTTGKNIVIIMLDRAMGSFVPFILEESPDLNEALDGFTFYPNTVSFSGFTRIGAPPLFGGYEYVPLEINRRADVPLVTKHNESLLLLPRLFSEAGYKTTVTDPPFPNYSLRDDLRFYADYPGIKALITDGVYTKYWIAEHQLKLPTISDLLKRNFFWYALFRVTPIFIRYDLYREGDWCAPFSQADLLTCLDGYAPLDYLPRFTKITDENENTFLFTVNLMTHEGSLLQAPEYRPAVNLSISGTSPFKGFVGYHTNIAALKRLTEWFAWLKEKGVYDNTRIIICSDHGIPKPAGLVLPNPVGGPIIDNFNPTLFHKDFGERGLLKFDETFMSNADVPAMALAGLIENPHNPFTGNPIEDGTKAKESPLYISNIKSGLNPKHGDQFELDPKIDWLVHTDMRKSENWTHASAP